VAIKLAGWAIDSDKEKIWVYRTKTPIYPILHYKRLWRIRRNISKHGHIYFLMICVALMSWFAISTVDNYHAIDVNQHLQLKQQELNEQKLIQGNQ
jgi:hypothetical protein